MNNISSVCKGGRWPENFKQLRTNIQSTSTYNSWVAGEWANALSYQIINGDSGHSAVLGTLF